MSSNRIWNCCEDKNEDEDFMCCSKCKKAYHNKCLFSYGYKDVTGISSATGLEWVCPACTSKSSRGNNENNPIRRTDTKSSHDQNITKRSNKRVALSSPPKLSPMHSLGQSEYRAMVKDIIKTELNEMLIEMKLSMKNLLSEELKDIKQEMIEMKSSISFISKQYDDIIVEHRTNTKCLSELRENNTKMENDIHSLNIRINELEQRSRACNLELQCVPENTNENLITVIKQLGRVVGLEMPQEKILNCTRVAKANRSSPRPRSIVVQFNSPLTKDTLLASVIKFNKNNQTDKLNTAHLGLGGEKKPIFVMEHLSPSNKALHAAARLKAKEKKYKYVWVRNGRILMRKDDNSDPIIVRSMGHLSNLS